MEVAAWHREPHSKRLCPYIFTCKCSLQSHWSGWRPLVSATLSMLGPHWDSSRTPCCFLSCGDLWLWVCGSGLSSALADHRWSGNWSRPSHNPGSGPGQLQGWSACQFSPILTTRVSSPALSWLIHLLQQWARVRPVLLPSYPHGWLSHT